MMKQLRLFTSLLLFTAASQAPGVASAAGASNPSGPVVPPTPWPVPAPTNLAFTTDPLTCSKFRSDVPPRADDRPDSPRTVCLDAARIANSGTFHWDWHGNGSHPSAVGFSLYRIDGGRHDLIERQIKATEGNTVVLFGKVVQGACYVVTAYDLSAESAASTALCLANQLPIVAPASPPAVSPPALPPVQKLPSGVSSSAPAGGVAVQSAAVRLPPPWRLLAFRDPKPCASHGGLAGGLACKAILARGGLALVWEYGPAHIDGFRAYSVPSAGGPAAAPGRREPASSPAVVVRQAPNAPIAVQTARLDNGSIATLIVLDPRPRGFGSECFAVTAFAGGQESEMSPPLCVPPGSPGGEPQ
jgi:hypothetical protein